MRPLFSFAVVFEDFEFATSFVYNFCLYSATIYPDALGEMHPNYANSLNDLVELYMNLGVYSKAEQLCQLPLAVCKATNLTHERKSV
jgi:hypothetical protein